VTELVADSVEGLSQAMEDDLELWAADMTEMGMSMREHDTLLAALSRVADSKLEMAVLTEHRQQSSLCLTRFVRFCALANSGQISGAGAARVARAFGMSHEKVGGPKPTPAVLRCCRRTRATAVQRERCIAASPHPHATRHLRMNRVGPLLGSGSKLLKSCVA
jgi:hypothetical protein